MNRWILSLPPNRARRNYRGGKLLDRFEAKKTCKDGIRPEDWIASLTPAKNPGMPVIENEGLATVINDDGQPILLKDLIEKDPVHFFGEQYINDHGTSPTFLLKLLDSAIRLNVQVHPTREFAQQVLGAPYGKLECYHIIDVRPGIDPYIRLGFQHPPSREEFKRIVMEQDISAMDACFEPVPVQKGETWLVPGGLPHAIGEGLFLIEIMEPSDLVARFEFERAGIVVPPEARFLGRDVDFALDMLDCSQLSASAARKKYEIKPKITSDEEVCKEEMLIDEDRVDCFRVKKIKVTAKSTLYKDPQFLTCIVLQGVAKVDVHGDKVRVQKGSKFLVPAAAEQLSIVPISDEPLIAVACFPGKE